MRKRTSEPKRKKAEVESEEEVPKAKPYVSHQIYLNIKKLENPFYRADIEFRGVDHSAES
jgi:hypothetical protein